MRSEKHSFRIYEEVVMMMVVSFRLGWALAFTLWLDVRGRMQTEYADVLQKDGHSPGSYSMPVGHDR
jgi:hypothetical protein